MASLPKGTELPATLVPIMAKADEEFCRSIVPHENDHERIPLNLAVDHL